MAHVVRQRNFRPLRESEPAAVPILSERPLQRGAKDDGDFAFVGVIIWFFTPPAQSPPKIYRCVGFLTGFPYSLAHSGSTKNPRRARCVNAVHRRLIPHTPLPSSWRCATVLASAFNTLAKSRKNILHGTAVTKTAVCDPAAGMTSSQSFPLLLQKPFKYMSGVSLRQP